MTSVYLQIKKYPRTVESSLRAEKSKRKEQRAKVKERKEKVCIVKFKFP